MGKKKKNKHITQPVVLAADKETLSCLTRALTAVGVSVRASVLGTKGWSESAADLFLDEPGLLVMVSSPKLGSKQIALARQVIEGGGGVLAWTRSLGPAASRKDDAWIVDRLLEQVGARTTASLSTLSTAAQIYDWARGVKSIRLNKKGSASSVSGLVVAAFEESGILVSNASDGLVVQVNPSGGFSLSDDLDHKFSFEDPSILAAALSLLAVQNDVGSAETLHIEPDEMELALILQPPKRLLSEIASKRLLRTFGMVTPFEQLCQSPSEAARFAKNISGPAVFKLVKPRLEQKASHEAVISNVLGAAQARRAAGELTALGNSLGGPVTLGVLVAEQIADGPRLSVEICDHKKFGRLLFGYKGDTLHEHPDMVLAVPATIANVAQALYRTGLTDTNSAVSKLSRTVARFSSAVYELGLQIDRAEIHPLAPTMDEEEAVVLDALISVALVG